MTEQQLQAQTAQLLAALGWLAWHTPNEGAQRLSRLGVVAGVSDWVILEAHDAGFGVAIELKTRTGRLSAAQERFLEQCSQRGMLTAVCRSYDEFAAVLRRVRPANGRVMP